MNRDVRTRLLWSAAFVCSVTWASDTHRCATQVLADLVEHSTPERRLHLEQTAELQNHNMACVGVCLANALQSLRVHAGLDPLTDLPEVVHSLQRKFPDTIRGANASQYEKMIPFLNDNFLPERHISFWTDSLPRGPFSESSHYFRHETLSRDHLQAQSNEIKILDLAFVSEKTGDFSNVGHSVLLQQLTPLANDTFKISFRDPVRMANEIEAPLTTLSLEIFEGGHWRTLALERAPAWNPSNPDYVTFITSVVTLRAEPK